MRGDPDFAHRTSQQQDRANRFIEQYMTKKLRVDGAPSGAGGASSSSSQEPHSQVPAVAPVEPVVIALADDSGVPHAGNVVMTEEDRKRKRDADDLSDDGQGPVDRNQIDEEGDEIIAGEETMEDETRGTK